MTAMPGHGGRRDPGRYFVSLMKKTMRVGVVAALTLCAAAACPGWAAAESAVDGSWQCQLCFYSLQPGERRHGV